MKALVLFSGGIDSTTALALAIDKHGKDNVIALSISYGQKHFYKRSENSLQQQLPVRPAKPPRS